MAETLISPGVLARENDISFIAPPALEAGAAIEKFGSFMIDGIKWRKLSSESTQYSQPTSF